MTKTESKKYLVGQDDYSKIDQVIKSFCDVPRSQLRAFFQHECVKLNGRICTNPGTPLKQGDEVVFTLDTSRRYKEKPKAQETKGFSVIYEDGHLIVVNKEAGILTVPTLKGETNTLVDNIKRYLPFDSHLDVVHRLDRDTSGVLVFAKSRGVARKIKDQFEKRKPERLYYAIVKGVIKKKSGSIKSYIATDKDLNQLSVKDEKQGKLALTFFEVEKVLDDATLVKVRLETGRRNQIRVHFADQDHPVLGDPRYKSSLAKHPKWTDKFLALHATTLGFKHPYNSKELFFESPMPLRMKMFLDS